MKLSKKYAPALMDHFGRIERIGTELYKTSREAQKAAESYTNKLSSWKPFFIYVSDTKK